MTDKLSELFPDMSCEGSLFYYWPIGIRFEIADPEMPYLLETGTYNSDYFSRALARAEAVFDAAFSADDEITVIYDLFSYGRRRIKKRCLVFQQIAEPSSADYLYQDLDSIWLDENDPKCYCLKRVQISTSVRNVHRTKLIEASLHTDFPDRKPNFSGRCYFLNRTRGIIYCLYDDRGLDLIATEKSSLADIYRNLGHWILEHDRERIDECFREEEN
ncbi:DUF3885 domain-containing protein [Aestuariispira insulae]|uniref:Uncharacterized protein DUF3885 n=1 Tax=Aestuariispira insulae TaxID=1461337 RepID=A0A3D9HRR2_9PROT|nr:DUF3885 domain-containing protein [Aestuariispira insulae]RED52203.1 uncharacterized protein DUF3885 [Aestuariispira insulae]